MKRIWIITLFPQFFKPLFETGVVGSAMRGERGPMPQICFINPSEHSEKGFKGVDSSPYGGGAGQVMRADILEKCLWEGVLAREGPLSPSLEKEEMQKFHVVYLGPRGEVFNAHKAREYGQKYLRSQETSENFPQRIKELVFICGRYEGVDERFLETYVDEYISLGDFILSGGELALLPILDSIFRFYPGVLGNSLSFEDESFSEGLLEYPHYTRPALACGKEIPSILSSGHHGKIAQWRQAKALEMTRRYRPDLWKSYLERNGQAQDKEGKKEGAKKKGPKKKGEI